MTTIQLYCRGASAWTKVNGRITRGMVGLSVTLTCDKSWAGLTRSLIARNGEGERWVLAAVGDTAVVPHEALREAGSLYLCLEGRDADGHLVLPSNWASCGRIYDSGGGTPGTAEATPTELQQLMVLADQARKTAEEALRRADASGGSGEGGETADLTGYATENWVNANFGSKAEVQSAASAAASAGSAAAAAQSTAASALAKAQEALGSAGTGGGGLHHGDFVTDAYAYGFRTGYENRALNDAKMEKLLGELSGNWRNSLHFGTGEWWFTKGIDIPAGKLVCIYGDVIPTHGSRQTVLIFDPAGTWDCAINATAGGGMTLENIVISAGAGNTGDNHDTYRYYISFDRTKTEDSRYDRTDLFSEQGTDIAAGRNSTGLRVKNATMTNNVVFRFFWTAMDILTGNMSASNVLAQRCHTALRTQTDAFCTMIRADHCYTAWENWNVGNHMGSLRGDSVVHMIEASKGRFSVDETLDGDFCVGSLVVLGDPNGSSTIQGFTIQNAVSRCCARYSYPKTREYTMPAGVTQDCAWVTVLPNTTVNGGYIHFTNAQSITPSDNTWDYATPMPELCCGDGAVINNMQLVTQRREWADVSADNLNDKYIRGLNGTVIVDHGTDKLKIVRSGDQTVITSAFAGGGASGDSSGGQWVTVTKTLPLEPGKWLSTGTATGWACRTLESQTITAKSGDKVIFDIPDGITVTERRIYDGTVALLSTNSTVTEYVLNRDVSDLRISVASSNVNLGSGDRTGYILLQTSEWQSGGEVDTTLSRAGYAADAAAVGNALAQKLDTSRVRIMTQEEYDLLEAPSDSTIYIIVEASA